MRFAYAFAAALAAVSFSAGAADSAKVLRTALTPSSVTDAAALAPGSELMDGRLRSSDSIFCTPRMV